MLALTMQQRRFVVGWIETRGKNASRVARAAGYSDTKEGAKVRASNMLRNPKILAAMREEAERRMESLPILAVLALQDQVGHKNPKIAKETAIAILDRTGFGAASRIDVKVEHSLGAETTAELEAVARAFLANRPAPALIEGTVLEKSE